MSLSAGLTVFGMDFINETWNGWVLLNMGGHPVWEYPFWRRSFKGVWLIFFGYFHFYVAALLVIGMQTIRAKLIDVSSLYAIAANIYGMGIMGWVY